MVRSNGVAVVFQLGDVVIVRYSSYPYWPATVDACHQSKFKGRHSAMLRTRSGEKVLCYWCTFANEDTGGWVRADRMVLFHPSILDKIRVEKTNDWYRDQKDAIDSAIKSFRVIHKTGDGKPPQLPAELQNGTYDGRWDADDPGDILSDQEGTEEGKPEDPMDLGESDDEILEDEQSSRRHSGRSTKAGKTPARPKAKKEPRKPPKRKSLPVEDSRPKKRSKSSGKLERDLLDSVDNDSEEPRRRPRSRDEDEEPSRRPSGKRRRHSEAHPDESSKKARRLEEELADAKEAISTLKKSLKKKEKALAELTGDGAGVACVIPPLPPPIEEKLPNSGKYRSNPIDSSKFNSLMDKLSADYESFKESAEAADLARTDLEKTMETIKKLYHEACEKVSSAEDKATKKEGDIVRNLREILEADVEVQDLRERKAGHKVRAMLKKCKGLPAIHDFCEAIYRSWKVQVVDYMKEHEGKKNPQSPTAAKSSQEKSEGKGLESPAGSAKASPKDKAGEDSASPNEKKDKPEKEKDNDVKVKNDKSTSGKGEAQNNDEGNEEDKMKDEDQTAVSTKKDPEGEDKEVHKEAADKKEVAKERKPKSEDLKGDDEPPKKVSDEESPTKVALDDESPKKSGLGAKEENRQKAPEKVEKK